MTGALHLARIATSEDATGPDRAVAAALLELEAATQDRPLGLDGLLREAEDDGVVLVAREDGPDGQVIGFASARLLVAEAHVVRLAVSEAHRRRGTGRALLDGLIAWAVTSGAEALLLEVRAGNAAALALYARAGFEVEGRRDGYYPDGEAALLLRRVLVARPRGGEG